MNRQTIIFTLVLLFLAMSAGTAAAQTGEALWFASYWDNPDQDGDPARTTTEGIIEHNWGKGSPVATVSADNWSARWTAYVDFTPGTYRFTVTSDDGVRVFVGDKHIITDWTKHPARTYVANVSLAGGNYPVAVDYFEDVGNAQLKVRWERTGPPLAGGDYVTIISSEQVGPAPSPAPQDSWYASYWNNRQLQGDPAVSRYEVAINYNWGNGAPVAGVGPDNFSARWTRQQYFAAGTYRFTAIVDDGMRVWVDGSLIIDSWYDSPTHTVTADHYLGNGNHQLRVEYYEHGGGAVASFSWRWVSSPAPPAPPPALSNFRGEYFNNISLGGSPMVVRDDASINFNWGNGTPVPGVTPADNFSARWTRTLDLVPGRYRFAVTSDDGVRLWVDNRLLIDRWYDHAAESYEAELDWPGGAVPVRLDYYERAGLARVSLSWSRLGTAGDTGGQPVATVNTAWLNFRTGPGTAHTIITTLPHRTPVSLMARNAAGNWVYVTIPDGRQGWIHAGYIVSSYPIRTLPVSG